MPKVILTGDETGLRRYKVPWRRLAQKLALRAENEEVGIPVGSYKAKTPQRYTEIKRCCSPPLLFFVAISQYLTMPNLQLKLEDARVFPIVCNVLYHLLPHTFHNPLAPESCTPFASITTALDASRRDRLSIPSLELKVQMPPNVYILLFVSLGCLKWKILHLTLRKHNPWKTQAN